MLRRLAVAFGLAAALGPAPQPVAAPPNVVLVVGHGPMQAGDEMLRRRLEGRGYAVVVAADAALGDARQGQALAVVVSSSADPALAVGLREAAVPVVVLQPLLFGPLGLSGAGLGTDFGYDSTLGRAGVAIRDGRHALAAGASGTVRVATRPIDIGWARPAGAATVVATLAGEPDRAVAFAYEKDAAMVGLDAPARRAGVFAHAAAAPFLTRTGWQMFDAAVDWAAGREVTLPEDSQEGEDAGVAPEVPATTRSGASGPQSPLITKTALFVVGATPPANSGDDKVRQRLETNLGYTVTVRVSDATIAGSEANGKTLVVISSTANPTNVAAKFKSVTVPVMLWRNDLFDDMSMAAAGSFGTQATQSSVVIVTASHPLAAGLTGTPGILTSGNSTFTWATPAASAATGARINIASPTNHYCSFGYLSGATMVSSFVAPARRVGFFLGDSTAASLNTNGWKLFDAAVLWAANVANSEPIVSAGPDRAVMIPAAAALDGTVSDDGMPFPQNLTQTWTRTSGPGTVTFGSASSVDTTATFSTAGTYVLRLTASDGALSSFDEMTVTVSPQVNTAPTVNAGTDQTVSLPAAASLVGTVSDDGLPNPPAAVTATWSKISGPGSVAFGNPNAVATSATFSVAGTYVLRLTASDSVLSAFDELTATVNPAPKTALFVANSTTLGSGDAAAKSRLESLGYIVTVRTSSLPASDVTGKTLVIVSSTLPDSADATVAPKVRDVTVPVLTWERPMFDDIGLVASGAVGTRTSQTTATVLLPDHPLAGGVSGTPTLTTSNTTYNWGNPGTAAARVVADPLDSTHAYAFGYDTGAAMIGLNAPARRVGFFLGDTTETLLTTEGWALFDGAVAWATGTPLPKVATPTFSLPSGAYAPGQAVTVSVATTGATIRNSLTGDDPTPADPAVASGGSLVLGNYTLKAKAWKPGFQPSDVATATYTLTGPFTAGMVVGGAMHSLAVASDGTLWSWGNNDSDTLGYPGTGPVPRRVGAPTGVTAASAGGAHSMALKSDGTVWAWGNNNSGQLGDGTTNPHAVPAPVAGLSGIVAIAAGSTRSLAVGSTGTVWTWGDGQLTPVAVSGVAGVTALATGNGHTLALTSTGTVWAWGWNDSGQLGNGTTDPSSTPFQIPGLSGVTAIGAGGDHSLAVKSDGTVWAWGTNMSGESGQDPVAQPIVPSPALVGLAASPRAVRVAAGFGHSVAVREDGSVWSWGRADQVGHTVTGPPQVPGTVAGIAGAAQTYAGSSHTFILTADKSVWAWGFGDSRKLGDGTMKARVLPVGIAEAGFNWKVATPGFFPVGGTYADEQMVTLTTVTAGATIHYTAELREPTESDPALASGGTVPVTQHTVLRAKAWKTGQPPSNSDFEEYVFQAGAVTANPVPSFYDHPVSVALSCPTPGVAIRYTTDGTPPGPSATLYTGPFEVAHTATIRAIALREGWLPGSELNAQYYLNFGTLAVPVASPSGGTFVDGVPVTLTSIPGATIRYDYGSVHPWSPVYTGPVTVSFSTTLAFYAEHQDYDPSPAGSASFTIKPFPPSFNPPPGAYARGQLITATSATAGAVVRYTLDGSEPGLADPPFPESGIPLFAPLTVTARAFTGEVSDTITAAYTLTTPVAEAPTFIPGGGTYTGTQAVTLQTGTPGATVRYTLDGSDPTFWSTVYVAPIQVDVPLTIRARAFLADWLPSPVAGATYVTTSARVAGPALSPPPGAYATAPTVTAASSTPGAVVRYTLNGRDPTTADPPLPAGGVRIARSLPLKARAFKDGLTDSLVVGGVYLVGGALSTGAEHALAVKPDGTVLAWGNGADGRLGTGNTDDATMPTVIDGLTDVVAVAAGPRHSLALKNDGSVWSWGDNQVGQLGDGTWTGRASPALVDGLADVAAVAAGADFSLALGRDGTVWAWGNGPNLPALVRGLPPRLVAVAAGTEAVVLAADGSVWAWTPSWGTVVPRMIDFDGVERIEAGDQHYFGIRTGGGTGGALCAWGRNAQGQLGDGTWDSRGFALPVPGFGSAIGVAGGVDFSVAVKPDGMVWTWGTNQLGQLGDGSPWDSTRLRPGWLYRLRDIVAVSAGDAFALAVRADGTVWAWGANTHGQLGNGSSVTAFVPVQVSGLLLADPSDTDADADGDGLSMLREMELGTDPLKADTNDDGILDGAAVAAGISPTDPDMDGDGVPNAVERSRGTDPFRADTDGDGVGDATDCFPLDPGRSQCPPSDPGDTTPPIITLTEPTNATLISVVPPP